MIALHRKCALLNITVEEFLKSRYC